VDFALIVAPYLLYVTVSGAILYSGAMLLSILLPLAPRSKMMLYASALLLPMFTYSYYLRHMTAGCDMVGNPGAIRICTLSAHYSEFLAPFTVVLMMGYVAWRVWQVASKRAKLGREITDRFHSGRVYALLLELRYTEELTVAVLDSHYPMAFVRGVFRPELVLTRGLLELLGDEELKAVLAHELAHIAGGDNVYNLVHVLRDLAFFSPFAHLAWASYAAEREMAADYASIGRCTETDLAGAILKVARRGQDLSSFAWQHSHFYRPSSISRRIRAILSDHRQVALVPLWLLLALLSSTILGLC